MLVVHTRLGYYYGHNLDDTSDDAVSVLDGMAVTITVSSGLSVQMWHSSRVVLGHIDFFKVAIGGIT